MSENRLQMVPLYDRFARAASREIGARHLEDDVCRSTRIPAPAGTEMKDGFTTGCGNEAKFALPVTGEDGSDLKKPDPAVVCVVDDMAYEFPRYGG